MKNALLILFAVGTLAFAGLFVAQSVHTTRQQREAARLQAALNERAQEIEKLAQAQEAAERQKAVLAAVTEELSKQLKDLHQAITNTASKPAEEAPPAQTAANSEAGKGGGFGKMLSGLMSDPQMKKFMRDQQTAMLDKMYDPLIRRLNLTPDEGAKLKELLADNMARSTEKAAALFGGSATNRAAAVSDMAADQKTLEDQVRSLLGEDRYSQYKSYQDTVGERAQLDQFKQQATGLERPINDQQTEQLLSLMREEKQAVAAQTGQTFPTGGEGMRAAMSEADSEKLLDSQAQVNARVLERAKGILWPDQIDALSRYQTNQLNMMRMGLNMARKFMAPEGEAN